MNTTVVEVGGHVLPLSTGPVSFTGEANKAGKKVLGAGIGRSVDIVAQEARKPCSERP